jgi:hypothetical protein
VPDSAVADAGVYSVCERLCLDARPATSSGGGWTADLDGVAVSTAGRGGVANVGAGSVAEGSDVNSARGDRVSTVGPLEYSLVSSELVTHGRAASPLESASRSTMRFTRLFRAFALVAARSGDGWCDEEGEKAGLLEGLARFDAAGGTAIAAVVATPTGAVDGE